MSTVKQPATARNSVRQQWRWRQLATGIGLLLCAFISLAFITNVSDELSGEDIAVFEKDLDLRTLPRPLSYEEELRTIRIVQARIFAKAPLGAGIPEYEPREPADLMKYGQGLCFDRSRITDKALAYLGFKSRHVYILFRDGYSFPEALFHYRHPSHAVTEVKTSKGWLFIDSNTDWIAVTRDGQPVGADEVWKRINEFDAPPNYLKNPWWAIRGLYSRKGSLYRPFIPFPQLNWPDFVVWMIGK